MYKLIFKLTEVEWGEVKCNIVMGEGEVFMETVYMSSKWWEVKDWGESVSELVTGEKNNNNNDKLYTVLLHLGVFTFCTCCKISNLSRVYCW